MIAECVGDSGALFTSGGRMWRCCVFALALIFAFDTPVGAQVSTTNCQIIGNQVMCNTQQGVMQMRGCGEDLGRSLGNVMNQAIIARRRRQAEQAYTQALVEAQRRADAAARAQEQAWADAAMRAESQASIENDREMARQRLFAEKAVSVVVETSESMRFQGKVQEAWVAGVTSTLQDLYKVNPEASRLQIFDAVAPKLNIILRAKGDYVRRHLAHEPIFSRYQRLNLPAYPDPAYEAFWDPIYKATEPLFMEWPDEINVERFAEAVEPIFAAEEKKRVAPKRTPPRKRSPTPSLPD